MNCYLQFSGNTSVSLANGTIVPVTGIGKVSLSHAPTLSHVFHVPGLDKNLVSVSQLTKSLNCCALFFPTHCVFQDLSSGTMIGSGKERRGRYYLDTGPTQILHHAAGAKEKSDPSWSLWHKRFGHVNYQRIQSMAASGLIPLSSMSVTQESHGCVTFQLSKNVKLPFSNSQTRCTAPLNMIHTYVWGPAPVASSSGSFDFVTFIEDYSRVTWVFIFKRKSDVFERNSFINRTQFERLIRIIRSDNGGSYESYRFREYLDSHGILNQTNFVFAYSRTKWSSRAQKQTSP